MLEAVIGQVDFLPRVVRPLVAQLLIIAPMAEDGFVGLPQLERGEHVLGIDVGHAQGRFGIGHALQMAFPYQRRAPAAGGENIDESGGRQRQGDAVVARPMK